MAVELGGVVVQRPSPDAALAAQMLRSQFRWPPKSTAAPDITGGHDPADLPAYPIREAAHYLWIPASKIRRWAQGYRMAGIAYSPVIEMADPEGGRLSFNNLAELHILGALRDEQISLQKLRQAIAYLRRRVLDQHHPHPLLAVDLQTDGLSLFIKHLGQVLNVTREGQLAIKEVFEAHFRRIERDPARMTALRFYPYVRPVRTGERGGLDQPCPVAIDPRVSFGRPVLAGTGIPTSALAERFSAGESIHSIARDLELAPEAIEVAIRYQLDDRAA